MTLIKPYQRYLITSLLIVLTSCSTLSGKITKNKKPNQGIKMLDASTLAFKGKTTKTNVEAFEVLLNANKVERVVITSGGGNVEGGMKLGELIRDHQLPVTVKKVCGSSCANYVLTASPKVMVSEGALIGWHGGALQPLYSEMKPEGLNVIKFWLLEDEFNQYLTKWRHQEKLFFSTISANQLVTVLGMMPGLKEQRDTELYSYDQASLKKLGLNIHFEDKQIEHTSKGKKVVNVFTLTNEEFNQLSLLHQQTLASFEQTSRQKQKRQ